MVDNAFLGDRPALAREAETLLNETKSDLWRSPASEEIVAGCYAVLGDADRAVPLLVHVLSIDYENALTRASLRLDPIWDRIRNDPRFQKLANGPP